jgi:glycosyltransferase involved in cell wall biosynthesis
MACGLAIVTSDDPANRALVQASGAGACLPLADPGVAESALRAAMTGDTWKQWSSHSRAHAVAHFSWPRVAHDYARLFAAEQASG